MYQRNLSPALHLRQVLRYSSHESKATVLELLVYLFIGTRVSRRVPIHSVNKDTPSCVPSCVRVRTLKAFSFCYSGWSFVRVLRNDTSSSSTTLETFQLTSRDIISGFTGILSSTISNFMCIIRVKETTDFTPRCLLRSP